MTDDIEEIRRQKRENLKSKVQDDGGTGSEGSPGKPIHVGGRADMRSTTTDHHVVLADFYADWCGPCKMLEPVVETIAAETDATVAKVDIDAQEELAAEYGVRSVPTLLLFVDGEPVERLVGMQDESRLRSLVESHTSASTQ